MRLPSSPLATVLAVAVAAGSLLAITATPASAHAIMDLTGKQAYAGLTSTMTLEVQHGCLQNQAGIDKVAAYFNKKFGKVTPQSVTGWSGKVSRTSEVRRTTVPSYPRQSPGGRRRLSARPTVARSPGH